LILNIRRDVRVVEGARLESVCRGNSTVGSNPTLSANFQHKAHRVRSGLHGVPRCVRVVGIHGGRLRRGATRGVGVRIADPPYDVESSSTLDSGSRGRSTAHGRVAGTAPRRCCPRAPVHAPHQGSTAHSAISCGSSTRLAASTARATARQPGKCPHSAIADAAPHADAGVLER
jgi:hypothetical protein